MLRVLACIHMSCDRKSDLEPLVQDQAIPHGSFWQIGLKKKVPLVDSWAYDSPWYRFHHDGAEIMESELYMFLVAHHALRKHQIANKPGIRYPSLVLCPVDQSFEEEFSCFLGHKTMAVLNDLGLGLQIAPAPSMPEVPFWVDCV